MKKTRHIFKFSSLIVCLALLGALLAACGGGTAGGPVTVTDMMGREVTLERPADKVVAIDAANCEILYALGAGSTLIGRGEYCNYPTEVLDVPAVQSGFETNVEQIIALQPQVVLMATMNQPVEQVEALENAGIKVVAIEAASIEDVYTAIDLVGTVVGKPAEAEALVNGMKADFAAIAAKVPQEGGAAKSVYFEVSPLEWGLWAAGANTFMDEIAALLGLDNIFSDVTGWAEVSQEQVIARAPDLIVTITMYMGEGPTPDEEIISRAGWETIPAVELNQIYMADTDTITRPGPRLADAAEALYTYLHGA